MAFISRKIKEKSSPFLKERSLNRAVSPKVFFGPKIIQKNKGRFVFSKKLWLWLIVFLIIFFYLFFGLKNLFSSPEIIVYSPEDNFVTRDKAVKIKGRVKGEARVAINDQIVILNQNSFEETLTLTLGVNLIKISARKRFGPEKVIFRRIIVE